MKMIIAHNLSGKFGGDLKLIRASEGATTRTSALSIDEDYDIHQFATGKVEVIKMEGGHRTFLSKNHEQIAEHIEQFYLSIACA